MKIPSGWRVSTPHQPSKQYQYLHPFSIVSSWFFFLLYRVLPSSFMDHGTHLITIPYQLTESLTSLDFLLHQAVISIGLSNSPRHCFAHLPSWCPANWEVHPAKRRASYWLQAWQMKSCCSGVRVRVGNFHVQMRYTRKIHMGNGLFLIPDGLVKWWLQVSGVFF